MKWFKVWIGDVTSVEFRSAPAAVRGYWLELAAYCAQTETGTIPGMKLWGDRQWAAFPLTMRQVEKVVENKLAKFVENEFFLEIFSFKNLRTIIPEKSVACNNAESQEQPTLKREDTGIHIDTEKKPSTDKKPRARKSASRTPSDTARTLWAMQELLRKESIPMSRPLGGSDEQLIRIDLVLEAGHSVEDCEHVLRVYASQAEADPDSARWFNGETNWRIANFRRALGQVPKRVDKPYKSVLKPEW